MSAKKGTNVFVDNDSGFISGPQDSASCEIEPLETSEQTSESSSKTQAVNEGDCEVILKITDELADFRLRDSEPTVPVQLRPPIPAGLPPVSTLFEPDEEGDTQLHIASIHGSAKAVDILIRICPDKSWLDAPNDEGLTPLHLAVLSGNDVATWMLVCAGASVALRDDLGETPLHKATRLNSIPCLEALLTVPKTGQQKRLSSSVLNQKNFNGQACVHLAASSGNVQTLEKLVHYGVDINCMENLAGWTPLHIAAHRGHVEMVQYLRDRCPRVDMRARDFAGRTARRLARRTDAARAFASMSDDGDSDSDDEIDYDSESEDLFEMLSATLTNQPINVA